MKKNNLPKLELNKRTIANLNNTEMRYVVGGGGDDEGDISRTACEDEENSEIMSDIRELTNKIALTFVFNCKLG